MRRKSPKKRSGRKRRMPLKRAERLLMVSLSSKQANTLFELRRRTV